MEHTFIPRGICATKITFELDGEIVKDVKFNGGCNGNLKAIATLVDGMTVEQIRTKLTGIRCGFKSTSCSDQLVKALEGALEQSQES